MARAHVRSDDAAEEIAQSVFATIATKLNAGEYTEQGRFEAWLFRVTMNRVRDEARRLKRHATPTDPASLANLRLTDDDADRAGPDAREIRRLHHALAQLNDADREVVELRHHASLSFQQIADTLEAPLGTVLARHHRALRKLRTIMEEQTP
jgi:RNA polymerase sigma-70 factor (ECF subfamily)